MLSIAEIFSRGGLRGRNSFKAGIIINEHILTVQQTRRHVEVLGRWFDFIHHDQLLDRMERPRARPFCLLTFDDGKRSGYTETASELERLGVPAVFYVTTRFLTDGLPLWFDRYENLISRLGFVPPGLEAATVKEIPIALINERLDRACAKYSISIDMEDDAISPMSWDNARDLERRGFKIGAHGARHTILTRETEADAIREIEESIVAVTSELKTPCTTFAFPNGNYTASLAKFALKCGVQTVMTTEPLWADNRFPPWRIPRLQLFGTQSKFKIEMKLALAATGHLLANPDGTGRLYRRIRRLEESERSTRGAQPSIVALRGS